MMRLRCLIQVFVLGPIGIAMGSLSLAHAQQMPIFGGFEIKTLTKEEAKVAEHQDRSQTAQDPAA